jgi:nucleoid-associated protein YgaU
MGLFDFARNIGHALFNTDDSAAEKIKAHIDADNPGIDPLDVKFDNGQVTLSGASQTWDAVEKAVLMAGNVKGVEKVINQIQVADSAGNAPSALGGSKGNQYYEIKSGDTLSALAKQFYGDASQYPKIFAANREVIKDPNKIFVGQKITIPA